MISRNDKGFFAAHWDWLVAGLGVLVLAGGAAVLCLEPAADEEGFGGGAARARGKGPEAVDLAPFDERVARFEAPARIVEPAETSDSYLASGRRVFCEAGDPSEGKKGCGRPIPFGVKVCPYADCGVRQPEEVKVEVDTDGDGLFDEWEKKYGLNPNDPADADADLDGDGFTNIEERDAGTDPSDPASHPDYRDSLQLVLPLKQMTLPFYFERVTPLPGGDYRFSFKDPKKKNDYGVMGRVYTPKTGEAIGDTGFVVKSYAHKTEKRVITADKTVSKEITREIDVSTATIERKSDKKTIVVTLGRKDTPVDVRAPLRYVRGETKDLLVAKGDVVDLNGTKFTIDDIVRDGKKVRVTVGHGELGKKTIEALEQ